MDKSYDFLFEGKNNDFDDEYKDYIEKENAKSDCVNGYELLVIFDTERKLTEKESQELCEKIMEDLLESSDIVSVLLKPITKEE